MLSEHLFDVDVDTPIGYHGAPGGPWISTSGRGHLVGVAHGQPDASGVDAGLQRLLDRASAEVGEDVVARHRGGPSGAELLDHELTELGESHASTVMPHRPIPAAHTTAGATVARGTVSGMPLLLAQGDPTGFSSPLGQVVVFLALLSSLVLLLRWWWQQRRR
jgi:hypothetical protein